MSRLDERLEAKRKLPTADTSHVVSPKTTRLARRDFLKTSAAAGGGLCIAAFVPELAARPVSNAPANATVFAPNAFVRIAADESVTVIANHSEMGQGIYTSLPMLLNEELQADWSRIRVEAAPVDAAYNHTVFGIQMTGGSTTTPSECHAEKGVVIHAASSKKATYGSLADAASQLKPPANVPLKDPKQFTLIGKPVRRLDTPSKVNGTAQFGLDVRLPGMVYAVVERPPVFGGKVVSVDAADTLRIPGVRAVA